MSAPSLWGILILVLLVLLLFGARRLPEMASSVGKSMKILRKDIKDLSDGDDDAQPPHGSHQPRHDAPAAAERTAEPDRPSGGHGSPPA